MIIFTDEELEVLKKSVKRQRNRNGNDKILDNTLNRGEVEYESFKEIKVDNTWSGAQPPERYNSYDNYQNIQLNILIGEIYKDTSWDKFYSNIKRIPKQELSEIFAFIKTKLSKSNLSNRPSLPSSIPNPHSTNSGLILVYIATPLDLPRSLV